MLLWEKTLTGAESTSGIGVGQCEATLSKKLTEKVRKQYGQIVYTERPYKVRKNVQNSVLRNAWYGTFRRSGFCGFEGK